MRNGKILNTNLSSNETDPFGFLGELNMDQIRAVQERMYMLSQISNIKLKYAEHIYAELILQNSSVKNHYGGLSTQSTGEMVAKSIISENIIYCGDSFSSFFVLCNPLSAEPCVVSDVYDFLYGGNTSYSKNVLLQYIQKSKEREESLFSDLTKKTAKNGAKLGAAYGLDKAGGYLASRAGRLESLALHYSSGHATTMRVNSSFRGKVAQTNAFKSLFRKSSTFATYAARHKAASSTLGFIAGRLRKGSFKPITLADALMPMEFGYGTWDAREKERMSVIIPIELDNYCAKHNNYLFIINQQYFEQG